MDTSTFVLSAAIAVNLVISAALFLEIRKIKKKTNRFQFIERTSTRVHPFKLEKRIRKRYVVFSVISQENIGREEIQERIRKAVSKLYGEPFLSFSHISLIFYDEQRKIGILRSRREVVDQLIASFYLAGKDRSSKMLIFPLKTVGSIKKAKKIADELKPKS
ncbi:MAG: Rpp14/Pop5 family protein [Fervidicoccaceae archaeon]